MTPLADRRYQVDFIGERYWVVDTHVTPPKEKHWLKSFRKRIEAQDAATAMNAWHEVQQQKAGAK